MRKLGKIRQTIGKQLLCVMSFCALLLLFPLTASAETVTEYDLWVGGVRVTSENAGGITGANITGTVSYDHDTKTLTLNNATITGAKGSNQRYLDDSHGIYAPLGFDGLTLVLEGSSTITGVDGLSSYGIMVEGGDLVFKGSGSLKASTVDVSSAGKITWSVAIYAYQSITVNNGCTIEANCGTADTVAQPLYSVFELILNGTKISAVKDVDGKPVENPGTSYDEMKNYRYMKLEPDTSTTPGETYSISLDRQKIEIFVEAGYSNYSPETVTVINTGTGATGELRVELAGSDADKFILSDSKLSSIDPSGNKVFSVGLKEGCDVGLYSDVKISVTGTNDISASVELCLTVHPERPVVTEVTGRFADAVYTKGETAAALEVSATVTDGGTLSYQWVIDNLVTFKIIKGATSPTFVPPTDEVGTTAYCCIVKNTKNGVSSYGSGFSPSATITVKESESGGNSGSSGTPEAPESPEVTYQIIEGAGNSLTVGSNETCVIRGNGEFAKFIGVKVDGSLLEQSNYTAKEGSTIIVLQAAYLNTLSSGTHTIEILWTDGSATTTLTMNPSITNNDDVDDEPFTSEPLIDVSPKTGDNASVMWVLCVVAFLGLCLLFIGKKGIRTGLF